MEPAVLSQQILLPTNDGRRQEGFRRLSGAIVEGSGHRLRVGDPPPAEDHEVLPHVPPPDRGFETHKGHEFLGENFHRAWLFGSQNSEFCPIPRRSAARFGQAKEWIKSKHIGIQSLYWIVLSKWEETFWHSCAMPVPWQTTPCRHMAWQSQPLSDCSLMKRVFLRKASCQQQFDDLQAFAKCAVIRDLHQSR